MKMQTIRILMTAALFCMALLTACNRTGAVAPEPTPATSGSQESAPLEGSYQPLAAEACAALAGAMETSVGVPFEVTDEAPFEDTINQVSGTGCLIQFEGTGAEVAQDFVSVSQSLGSLFREQGWTEDTQYLADAPAATQTAFKQDDQVCLLNVGWQTAAEAGTEPEAFTNATPEQQLWTIAANCARTGDS
ncbi:MAG TPA: hypothetical protein VF707_11710 [Ardenticatenaceae bacterium]|jgi:uncharacterized protein (DUF2237 family)